MHCLEAICCTLMFLLLRRQIWWLWLYANASYVYGNQRNMVTSHIFQVQHFPSILLTPSMDAMDGIRHGEGRKWCSLALSKSLHCTYSRCFLNVILLCYLIRIIWDMNMAKLNGYNFIAVKFLISAPLLRTPGETLFYSLLYPECPAHAQNKTTLNRVTYLEGFLNFRSWAKHFTYVISFNHGKCLCPR